MKINIDEKEKQQLELGEEEELYEHHRVVVDPGQFMIRIDKYLMDRLPNTSRNRIQNSAKNGFIFVNGTKVKQNYRVKPNDVITLVLPFPVQELDLIPENIPLEIPYEDDDLLVVNKPSNMVVHPGLGNYRGTLVNALVYHIDNLPHRTQDYYGRPGLVHRLDKHTTGLLVVAKTEYALNHLAKQFFDRTVERRYWALVWGDVKEDGTVTGHIGRSLKNRKVFMVYPEGDHGKHAVTHYKVLERFELVTLVECKLETGRTHQIRVHMKHIGHTLFNDLEYGGDKILKGTTNNKYSQFVQNCFDLIDGQALHAKTISFMHPTKNEFIEFNSELPTGYQQILDKWRNYTKNEELDS
ncbi:MAG: RluA family pseudouridine synthase [Crocinitomicaceae bacterium]|nr:RluA family pseudouridine synthase [Crocinitomicaceae bacterium]